MTLGPLELSFPLLLLGTATGLAYGVLGVAVVLIFRSSRIINFALGEVGAAGAVFLAVAVTRWNWWYWAALPVGLLLSGLLSASVNAVVLHRVRNSPPIMPLIATLGVGQLLFFVTGGFASLATADAAALAPPGFRSVELGGFLIDASRVAALIVAPAAVVTLSVFLARHRLGRAIRATTADPELVRTTGVSALAMSSLSWAIAGALAALVAVLLSPSGPASAQTLGFWLLLRALAAGALAGMDNLPRALAAGIVIGILEQAVFWNASSAGLREVVLFAVVATALALRRLPGGRGADKRQWLQVVPTSMATSVGSLLHAHVARWAAAAACAVAVLVLALSSPTAAVRLYFVAAFAVVGLSVGIVTGLGGQLSLAQFAVAGIAAAVSVQVTTATGNFILGLAGAAGAGALATVLLGLPVLRDRGAGLPVVTLAFAIAAESWLLFQPWVFADGVFPGQPIIGEVALDTPERYAFFAFAVLLVALVVARNVWRTNIGRRLIAQRDNDDAARVFSISPWKTRLQGYALGGSLAGVGGAAFVHGLPLATAGNFPVESSISSVAISALGGIATLWGPLLGAFYVAGLPEILPMGFGFLATTTLGWLLVILAFPGGLAQAGASLARRWSRRTGEAVSDPPSLAHVGGLSTLLPAERPDARSVADPLLQVRSVSKSFGDLMALDDVDLVVARGENVALIGPNGAGKTLLFDVVSGFAIPDGGRVLYDGLDVTACSPEKRADSGLIRSFEDAALFPTLSLIDVVRLALERRHRPSFARTLIQGPPAEGRSLQDARELLHVMGLGPYGHRRVGALSTGMRRLAELTCVVGLQPRLLLLDEASSGLAESEVEAFVQVLRGVVRHLDLTLVLIEHDLRVATELASRIVVMSAGRVAAVRTPDEVRRLSGMTLRTEAPKGGMIEP